MDRREVLRVGALGATSSLAGCVSRVTGWSSLQAVATSSVDRAVHLTLTVFVNSERATAVEIKLEANGTRTVEMDVAVPYGASLLYRVTRESADEPKEFGTEATTSLWGGNKCTFEPVIEISEHAWSVSAACIA